MYPPLIPRTLSHTTKSTKRNEGSGTAYAGQPHLPLTPAPCPLSPDTCRLAPDICYNPLHLSVP